MGSFFRVATVCALTIVLLGGTEIFRSNSREAQRLGSPRSRKPVDWSKFEATANARVATLASAERQGQKFIYDIPLTGKSVSEFIQRHAAERPEFAARIAARQARHVREGWQLRGSYLLRHVVRTRVRRGANTDLRARTLSELLEPTVLAEAQDSCGPPPDQPVPLQVSLQGEDCTTEELDGGMDVWDSPDSDDVMWDDYMDGTTTGDDGEMLHFYDSATVTADPLTINQDSSSFDFGDFDLVDVEVDEPQVQSKSVNTEYQWEAKAVKVNKTWHGLPCGDQIRIGKQIREDSKHNALQGYVVGALIGGWSPPSLFGGVILGAAVGYVAEDLDEGLTMTLTCFTDLLGSSVPEPTGVPPIESRSLTLRRTRW